MTNHGFGTNLRVPHAPACFAKHKYELDRRLHESGKQKPGICGIQSGFVPRPTLVSTNTRTKFVFVPPKILRREEGSCVLFRGLQFFQMATGHGYFSEHFKRFVPSIPTTCTCHENSGAPPLLQTRDHILRSCPLYDRTPLTLHFPRVSDPRWSFGRLFSKDNLPILANWLARSDAFSKAGVPHRQREPP